jgi:TRAP transporter TAXI family solute receptor
MAVGVLSTPGVLAEEAKLPPTLTLTAYDTGSSGFNIAVAVGKTLKDKQGTDVRVLPAGNDVARLAPLRANRAQASAMGIGTYFAQESVFEFAVKEWGPQQIRLLLSVTDCNAISLGVAKDTGVKEVKDLRGKRVGTVVGSPALNQNAFAVLAFGGLTRSDVKLVEFSSYGAMWKGMINNEVDAAIASNISGQVKEVETSPRGIVFPADAGRRPTGLGAAQQNWTLLSAAHVNLWIGCSRRRGGGAAGLSLSDLHGLCIATLRPRLQS